MRESPYIKSLPYHLPPVLGFAIVMAVTGPFGTYALMGLGDRLVYFVALGTLNWLQVILLAAWFGTLEPIDRWPVVGRMALVGLLASVPGTAEIFLLNAWMGRPIPLWALPGIFPENAFLTIVVSVVVGLFVEQRLRAAADIERGRVAALSPPNAPDAGPPDFFRRIPPALGSDLILLRLRDALGELGAGRGQQVHRSWWVANGAIASVERNAGRAILALRNGLRVPVSKSFRDQVKAAGWLDG